MESADSGAEFPLTVLKIEVPGGDVEVVSGRSDSGASVLALLRHEGRTVGVRRAAAGWTLTTLMAGIADLPGPTAALRQPSVTVAICTLGRHRRLADAVRAVLDQTTDAKVLVVDNDPGSGATRRALGEGLLASVTLVEEPRRGLSHARNAALRFTDSEVLAFTDDDAIPEPTWLERLLEPFAEHPEVGAVTGMVLPAELRTPAQHYFEEYVGFSKGVESTFWAVDPEREASISGTPGARGVLFPWTTGRVGSGNNMALRTQLLGDLHGFDVRLGAGTPSQGGEDLDIFTRVLLRGHVIAYTPDAIVWHYHRESVAELERQIVGNGVGMGAILTKWAVSDRRAIVSVVTGAVEVGRRALASRGRQHTDTIAPALPDAVRGRLLACELRGLGQGPWRYLQASRTRR